MSKSGFLLFIGVNQGQHIFEWEKNSKRSERGFSMTMFYSFESKNFTFTLILGRKFSTLKWVVLRFTPLTPFQVNLHYFHLFYI